MIGTEQGSTVSLEAVDGNYYLIKPGEGVLLSVPIEGTDATRFDDGSVTVANQSAGTRFTLAPTGSKATSLPPWGTAAKPDSLVRTYHAKDAATATAAFEKDAEELASSGLAPVSQSWAEPDRSARIIGGIIGLAIAMFGVLVLGGATLAGLPFIATGAFVMFLGSRAVRDGVLTVSYAQRSGDTSGEELTRPVAPDGSPADRLRTLDSLRAEGLVTDAEYSAMRTKILDAL